MRLYDLAYCGREAELAGGLEQAAQLGQRLGQGFVSPLYHQSG